MSRKRIIEKIHEELENDNITVDIIKDTINENIPLKNNKFRTRKHTNREVIDVTQLNEKDQIILRYYQLLLNEIFEIKQPNRNFIVKQLINILPYLNIYNYVSIFKFDFKSFFNNIEVDKVLNEIKRSPELYAKEFRFLNETFSPIENLKPGLGIVNSFSEILGKKFDKKVESTFYEKVVIYERYVDDCILIFDSPIDEQTIKEEILQIAIDIFGEQMSFNSKKTSFINFTNIDTQNYQELNFDFLGYAFIYNVNQSKIKFELGIAETKLTKQKEKLTEIVKSFKDNLNINLFLTRVDLYYKRLVYYGNDTTNSKKTWQVRGISDSYKEATQLFNFKNGNYSTKVLDSATTKLLTGEVLIDIFKKIFENESDYTKKEKRIIRKAESILNNYYQNDKFISSLYKNKSVLLNSQIGYTREYLIKVIRESKIRLNDDLSKFEYSDLIEVFLNCIYYVK